MVDLSKILEAQKDLHKMITPEILKAMSPEQRKLVKEGKMAFKLGENEKFSDKLDHLQKVLKDAKL